MVTMYGISNCDSVKKARAHLQAQGVAFEFVDFKKQSPTEDLLAAWVAQVDWQVLLNRKGTTWRQLSPEQQAQASDMGGACALMLQKPSVIKRPVIDWGQARLTVGFDPQGWGTRLP
jgi:Spx/MgsR family transcriptional regulator